jgi:hypothetical protein
MMNNTDPNKKPGVNAGVPVGYAVPASYKTPTVLFIYIVKSDKSLDGDINIYVKRKISIVI